MSNRDAVTLFAGGGIKTLGAMQAGYTPVLGVEYAPEIASVYAENVGAVKVAKVEETDPRPYAGIALLLASPVCSRASVANASRGETGEDLGAAEGVCRWLREARPEKFVLENVTQYREFESCKAILRTLTECGYWWSADNINFASHGVPQTRRRLIVRAVRDAMLPALPAPTPWIGWYAAIEDLIPTLPESRFAPWQLRRLPADLFESTLVGGANTSDVQAAPGVGVSAKAEPSRCVATNSQQWRALLIEGDAAGDRPPTCGTSAEPAFTLKTGSGGRVHRAFLVSNGGAHGDLFRQPGRDAPAVTAQSAGRVKGFLADCGNARAEGITVRPGDEPCHSITASALRRPVNDPKAFLVESKNANQERGDGLRAGHEPSTTVVTDHKVSHTPKAWLEQGRVVALTPRALARLQTIPDSYRLPESRRLACTIIGNAAPAEGMRRVIEGLS